MSAPGAVVIGTASERPTFRSALKAREFRWLITTYTVQAVGQTFGTVAITVAIFDQTGSTAWVAIAAAARLLPYVALSAPAGVLASRTPRRRLLAISVASRAVLALALAFAVLVSAPPALLVLLAFCITACGTPCYPSLAAAVPTVVPTEELAPANAILTGLETLAFIAGPAAGAAALILGSPAAALFANAAIFVVALVPVAKLRDSGGSPDVDDGSPGPSIAAGVRAIVSSGDVAAPLLLVVAVNLVYGGSLVGLVLVAEELLGTGRSGFAALNAAIGIGAFAGVLLTNRLAGARRPTLVLAGTTLLTGAPVALLAIVTVPAVAAALMVVSGIGSVLTEVIALTLLQRSTPRRVIACVFGILDSLMVCAILLGSLIASPLIHILGLRESLIVVGAVVPLSAVAVAAWLQSAAHRAERVEAELEPGVVLLTALPWLMGAPRPTLEALAATSTTERVDTGTRLIEQGHLPDDFFVLVRGHMEVRKWGPDQPECLVGEIVTGTGFGEIGLLRRVARTASVVATEPSEVMRINGERFVAAVNGVPQSAAVSPAGGLVARLGSGAATQ